MIDKLIEKIGAKGFAALATLVGILTTALLEEIRIFFEKMKSYEKGKNDARKEWEEQQKFWEQRVKDIKEDTDMKFKEKIKEYHELKKAFKEFKKKNKYNSNSL